MTVVRSRNISADWVKILVFFIGLALVVLNIARILNVPLTHDEYAPYKEIVRPYTEIIQFKAVSANNHILNTILRKFFVGTFADTPFWLRFDSLLAQVVFLFYSYFLCRRLFKGAVWQLCVFLLLNLHPFMFEFWGLSRGYGLSIAFMTGSVYYLLRYVDDSKIHLLNAGLLFSILAVYSNFTLLDHYCGLICFMVAKQFITEQGVRKNAGILKELFSVCLASLILFLLVADPLKKLRDANELYYGGTHNIVKDTIISVIKENLFLGGPSDTPLLYFLAISIVVITGIMGGYWFIKYVQGKVDHQVMTGILLWSLLAAPAIGILLQHKLLKVLYPIDRTVLYFIPLFILAFTYWLYYVGRDKIIGKVIVCLFAIFIVYNFVSNTNTDTTRMWWYGKNDLFVLKKIMEEKRNIQGKNKVCVYWIFQPTFDYYIETRYSNYFEPVTDVRYRAPGTDTTFDYYFISSDCNCTVPGNYAIDTAFFGGAFTLYKKKG